MLVSPEVGPNDILRHEAIRGTVRLHRGGVLDDCDIDAEGGLYGVVCVDDKSAWPESMAKIAPLFRASRSVVRGCDVRGATNAGILARWCEVAGGQIHDIGNDAIKVAAPSWIHGLQGVLLIYDLGLVSLAPSAHSDGIQPWAPCIIESQVHINMRPRSSAYQERGAAIYIEPDFGQNGPIVVRNGVTMLTRNGYCMQVVPKSGSGPSAGLMPHPVSVRGCYLHREDGKHPVNIEAPTTVFEGNRDLLTGRVIGKQPWMAA